MSGLRTLTARLTLTVVALVALAALVIGTATTLIMDRSLSDRLDQEVRASLGRALAAPPAPDGSRLIDLRNQAPGTVVAVLTADGTADEGRVLGDGPGVSEPLAAGVLRSLDEVPTDGRVVGLSPGDLGELRWAAAAIGGSRVVVGLPTADVADAVSTLVVAEVGLGLVAVVAAGGCGLLLVRRQLRPLRAVAETARAVARQPLASGEVEVTQRVPGALTDDSTEVGRVGAALNALLVHVEESLRARHQSEQQVRQFVADASHELRTPLATIRGYTELARRHPADDTVVREALGKVEGESGRMATLVEDLLLLARLDAGRPLERRPVDLTRLLLEAVEDAQVRAPEHVWRLDLPAEPVEVIGDEQRLHQVVTNLLSNAARHTPAGTTVTVSLQGDGFAVHDDGPGFPPDLLDRAFERFTRGDTARTRHAGGSAGLGLALVRAIVEAHGGRVTIASGPGRTTVRVRFDPSPG